MRVTLVCTTVIIWSLLIVQSVSAQPNCEEIKKENEYLRKAMKITSPLNSISSSNVDFNIIKCIGNKKEQTVDLILTLVNHDANQEFQFEKVFAIDMEGNEYKTLDIKIGSESTRNKIYTDVPVKTTIRFNKILPDCKILKTIPITYFYGAPGHTKEFEFRNINIAWE